VREQGAVRVTLKFPLKDYTPAQLLKWCGENEDFEQVLIIGKRKNGTACWHVSANTVEFLVVASIVAQDLVRKRVLK